MAEQTLGDKINAVNAYADFIQALCAQGQQALEAGVSNMDKTQRAMRKTARTFLEEVYTWPQVERRSGADVIFEAPDGTRVHYLYQGEGWGAMERLELAKGLAEDTL